MPAPNSPESPSGTRSFLRVAGPLVLLLGLVLLVIALVSFFSAFGGMEPPHYFWCAFVGMPLMVTGGGMCQFGYVGAVSLYVARETASATRTTARAIGEGWRESSSSEQPPSS